VALVIRDGLLALKRGRTTRRVGEVLTQVDPEGVSAAEAIMKSWVQDDASAVREGLIQQLRLGNPVARRQALAMVPQLRIEMPGSWLDWLLEAAADSDAGVRHEAARQLATWHRKDPVAVVKLRARAMPLLRAGLRQAEGTDRLEWAKAVVAWRDRTEAVDPEILALFQELEPAELMDLAHLLSGRLPFDRDALEAARRSGLLERWRSTPVQLDLELPPDTTAARCIGLFFGAKAPSREASRIVGLGIRSASVPLTRAELAQLRRELWRAPTADARLAAFEILLSQPTWDAKLEGLLIARMLADRRNLPWTLPAVHTQKASLSSQSRCLVTALDLVVAADSRWDRYTRIVALTGLREALGPRFSDPGPRLATWIDRLEARIYGVATTVPIPAEDQLWHALWFSPFADERLSAFEFLTYRPDLGTAKLMALLLRAATDRTNRSHYLRNLQFGDIKRSQFGAASLSPPIRFCVTLLQLATALDPRQVPAARLDALDGVQVAWSLTPQDPPSLVRSWSQWLERRLICQAHVRR
jgi:hypothetical protein